MTLALEEEFQRINNVMRACLPGFYFDPACRKILPISLVDAKPDPRIISKIDCKAVNYFFRQFIENNNDKFYFLTLNQDRFPEYLFRSLGTPYTLPLLEEGELVHDEKSSQFVIPDIEIDLDNLNITTATEYLSKVTGGITYLKLHGSAGWKYKGNTHSQMVFGTGKEGRIEADKLLKFYYELAKEIFKMGIDLLIFGYSFGDSHINKLIKEAIDKYDLRLHYVSNFTMEDFKKTNKDKSLWADFFDKKRIGYYVNSNPMFRHIPIDEYHQFANDIFHRDSIPGDPWSGIRTRFFGIE